MDVDMYNPGQSGSARMDYPSNTQALFALIVMIIVLLFILVYCCWGTMTCGRPADQPPTPAEEVNTINAIRQNSTESGMPDSRAVVIFPFNSMIYVGDGEQRRIYQLPSDDEKPPPYTELYNQSVPPPEPPPYINSTILTTENDPQIPLDLPPTYEDYLSTVTRLTKSTSVKSSSSGNAISTVRNNSSFNSHQTPMPENISLILRGGVNRCPSNREEICPIENIQETPQDDLGRHTEVNTTLENSTEMYKSNSETSVESLKAENTNNSSQTISSSDASNIQSSVTGLSNYNERENEASYNSIEIEHSGLLSQQESINETTTRLIPNRNELYNNEEVHNSNQFDGLDVRNTTSNNLVQNSNNLTESVINISNNEEHRS